MTTAQFEREDFPILPSGHPDYALMLMEIARRLSHGWHLREVSLTFNRSVGTLRTPDAQRVEIHSGKPETKGTGR